MSSRLQEMPIRRRLACAMLAALGALLLAGVAGAADMVDVVQKWRAFGMKEVTIARGSSLRFLNEDDFPHQVHTEGPGMDTDSALQSPGETLVVDFPTEGTFQVTCGIHPRMHMTVIVN